MATRWALVLAMVSCATASGCGPGTAAPLTQLQSVKTGALEIVLLSDHEAIRRGVAWLKVHQRVSGRWFTRSLNNDKAHYITHAGTGFAALALRACGVADD